MFQSSDTVLIQGFINVGRCIMTHTTRSQSKQEYVVLLFSVGPWCFTYFINGVKYRGHVSVTATGKSCQRWDAQQPHSHGQVSDNFPDGSLEEVANFCRNPDQKWWPWCYTMTDTRWEYCAIEDIVCRKYQMQFLYV